MSSSHSQSAMDAIVLYLTYSLAQLKRIPGSAIIGRYVKSSYQDDPGRTLLEVILVLFAVGTLLQNRTRARGRGGFVKLTEKEIDDLVEEWQPEPLVSQLDAQETHELDTLPVIQGPVSAKPRILQPNGKVVTVTNLASYNFTSLQTNERIRERAVETLRKYGLGSCGPPGFYGTIDVHMQLEQDLASFLGTESSIIYSQSFSTIPSVIPAFSKRGDIIVADRGVNFAIHKGIQISRSTVRWYDHGDMASLEEVLASVDREARKKGWPLTRRFIVTEGIFENDGMVTDLPKLIELKYKYKYRLILDECISFGTVGRTGRGLTELYNVPATDVDLLIGSMANGLCSTGGFCAGSEAAVEHQRATGTSFVFSAAIPALLAVSASEGMQVLTSTPSLLETLHENARAIRSVLEKEPLIEITSHPASPIIHISISHPIPTTLSPSTIPKTKNNPSSLHTHAEKGREDFITEDRMLQDVAEECLANGVLITRAKRLRGQEALEPRASLKIVATSGLTRKECEKAASVVRAACAKVLGRGRR